MKEDTDGKYTRADLCVMLLDFFQAGTETSSTTIKWIVLYLTINQVNFSVDLQIHFGTARNHEG